MRFVSSTAGIAFAKTVSRDSTPGNAPRAGRESQDVVDMVITRAMFTTSAEKSTTTDENTAQNALRRTMSWQS